MSAHTPGPWEHRATPESSYSDFSVFKRAPNRLISIASTDDEANARLMAAAPTMHDYVKARAVAGDVEAIQIMEAIHGNA